jgi:hypothetical protein
LPKHACCPIDVMHACSMKRKFADKHVNQTACSYLFKCTSAFLPVSTEVNAIEGELLYNLNLET